MNQSRKAPILITGFGPFAEHSENPSQLLAELLSRQSSDVESLILPVEWQSAQSLLERTLAAKSYRFVLMLGLAASRHTVTLEAGAKNIRLDRSDNDQITGTSPEAREIVAGESKWRSTSMDLPALLEQLQALTPTPFHQIDIGHDAGSYLCNFVYYLTLRQLSPQVPVLFVHLPKNCLEHPPLEILTGIIRFADRHS